MSELKPGDVVSFSPALIQGIVISKDGHRHLVELLPPDTRPLSHYVPTQALTKIENESEWSDAVCARKAERSLLGLDGLVTE
jgi:hypothetical protein